MGNFSEGKKSIIFFKCFDNYCFIKNLASKTQWNKIWMKEKQSVKYSYYNSLPCVNHVLFNALIYRFLNFYNPMLYLNIFQCDPCKVFMNRSARLLHDQIY